MIGSVTEAQAQMLAAEKGRRKRARREQEHAEAPGLTGAHEAAEAQLAEGDRARAAKAMLGDAVEPGPGSFREPGQVGAEQFTRGYIDSGDAAPSPMHQAPCAAPLPTARPGVLTPVRLPGVPIVAGTGPGVQGIAGHSVRAIITSPPMRGH